MSRPCRSVAFPPSRLVPSRSLPPRRIAAQITIALIAMVIAGVWPNHTDGADPDLGPTIDRLIHEMNSRSFATRERAMTQLYDLGSVAIAPLRERLATGVDRERAERIDQVIRRLSAGDLESRIDQFLAGGQVPLEGWGWTRSLMGDNRSIRRFFVDMMREFPEATPLLDGVTRDRGKALALFSKAVKGDLQFGGRMPSRAATVCLLLPIVDQDVPVDPELDQIVLSLERRVEGANALRDKAFAESYKRLLGAWMRRSDLSSREQVFQLGLRLELTAVIDLAIESLQVATQKDSFEIERRPSLIGSALQVVAAKGTPRDIELVQRFLKDNRPAIRDTFYGGRRIRTEVGDSAAAAIVSLLGRDLRDFGFDSPARPDPVYGFSFAEVGFPVGGEARRLAMKNHVRQLIDAHKAGTEGLPPGKRTDPGDDARFTPNREFPVLTPLEAPIPKPTEPRAPVRKRRLTAPATSDPPPESP